MATTPGPTPAQYELSVRVRALRLDAGITQAMLATILSVETPIKAGSVSSYENLKTDTTLPENRLEQYARLFGAGTRNADGRLVLTPKAELTAAQLADTAALEAELRQLWEAAQASTLAADDLPGPSASGTFRSWLFPDGGEVIIICPIAPDESRGPLANPDDPNHTRLHGLGDVDALLELWGHIRSENPPGLPVRFVGVDEVDSDHFTSHLVLLGGLGWNPIAGRVLRQLQHVPVRQVNDPKLKSGEPFVVEERSFMPVWAEGGEGSVLEEDVALLVRVPNPFNINRTLTILNGIHSRGVYGAVRALTDEKVRESNELYLATRFPSGQYAVLMRVPVVGGKVSSPVLANPLARLYEWTAPIGEVKQK